MVSFRLRTVCEFSFPCLALAHHRNDVLCMAGDGGTCQWLVLGKQQLYPESTWALLCPHGSPCSLLPQPPPGSCRVGDLQQRLLLHFSSPSTALGVLLVPGAFSWSWGAQTARTLPSRGRKGQGNPASGQARVCRTLSRPRKNVFCSTGLEECAAPSCPKGPSPLWVSIK